MIASNASKISANRLGIVLMITSMAFFTMADLFLKFSSEFVTTGQITLALGVGGTFMFWVLLKRKGETVFSSVFYEAPVILRTSGELVATLFIILALTYASFTSVAVILQTLPLLLTLCSFLFLKERVGVHRLSAILLGFGGVLLIIRPGTDGFDAYSLLAILAVVGMTMRDFGSRLVGSHISNERLAIFGTLGQIVLGIGLMAFEEGHSAPSLEVTLYLVGMVVFASVAILLVTKAMRTGEISAVSPFRYSRLFFGLLIGAFVLGETVDQMMIIGSAIIIFSGLYIWLRERKISR
ncbi:MAG TPA: DMT family transporter [Candidatus Thioglobus sp.]|jgi:drug/metabolite transporter (DMT)-like permease|nr:DMT family transporter [Candidatus Thioglobus sp.]